MSTWLFSWVSECSSPILHTLGNYREEFPVMTPRRWLQILKPKFNRSHKAFWVNLLSMSILLGMGKIPFLTWSALSYAGFSWLEEVLGWGWILFSLARKQTYIFFFFLVSFTIYWNYLHINFIFLYIFYYQKHLLSLSHRSLMIVHLLYFYVRNLFMLKLSR